MKKIPVWAWILGALLLVLLSLGGTYNNLVSMKEVTDSQWAQVLNSYQRRSDLIPNLVSTVQGFASQEKEVLIGVTEARSKVSQIKAESLTKENLEQFQAAQQGLSGALSRLMVVVEKYPELKSNQNFLALQTQLEGTENRISNERRVFNEKVQAYNKYTKMLPQSLFAAAFGFEAKPYFEGESGIETAPKVEF
jgi:LemA protein